MPRGRKKKSQDRPRDGSESDLEGQPDSREQKLRILLRQRKAVFSRFDGKARRAMAEGDSAEIVRATLPQAKSVFCEIEQLHDELLLCFDPKCDEYFTHVEWFEELESRYIGLCKEANAWLNADHDTRAIQSARLNADADPFVPDVKEFHMPELKNSKCLSVSGDSVVKKSEFDARVDSKQNKRVNTDAGELGQMLSAMHLPRPEIDKFSGDATEFLNFMQAFKARVCKMTSSDSDRLFFLHQLLVGDPRDLVDGCLYMSDATEGYNEAICLLQRHYGQAHVICDAFVKKFQSLPVVKQGDTRALKTCFLTANKCMRVMQSLGDAGVLDYPVTIQAIVVKLPSYLQNKWRDKVSRLSFEGRRILFADFVDFLNLAVSGANDPFYGQEALAQSRSTSFISQSHASSHATDIDHVTKPQCYLCQGFHFLSDCEDFRAKPLIERKEFVREKKLCFSCLGAFHRAANCKCKRSCSVCSRNHPTALHSDNVDAQSAHVACNDDPVMQPILPVRVTWGDRTKIAYALYDNGSTATFMTEKLMTDLQIRGAPDVALKLSTMHGGRTEHSRLVRNIVVRDMNGNNPIQIDCAYTRREIPVSKVRVPRPELMRKQPSVRDFADLVPPYIDEIGIGLVIGADCPRALMPLRVIPSSTGTYACLLRHGWTVSGPFPEFQDRSVKSRCDKGDVKL